MTNLTDLEAKAKAATPGPWEKECVFGSSDLPVAVTNVSTGKRLLMHEENTFTVDDVDFITAANPETVLALCRTVRGLVEALQHVKDCVAKDPERRVPYDDKLPEHLSSVVSSALDGMQVKP